MLYFWLALAAVVVAFFAVIIIRALRFTPKATAKVEPTEVAVDEKAIVEHFVDMIRCKTISYYEDERIDKAEFQKFRALLKKLYPHVSKACSYEEIGPSGVLFHLKLLAGAVAARPLAILAHPSAWQSAACPRPPPFQSLSRA